MSRAPDVSVYRRDSVTVPKIAVAIALSVLSLPMLAVGAAILVASILGVAFYLLILAAEPKQKKEA